VLALAQALPRSRARLRLRRKQWREVVVAEFPACGAAARNGHAFTKLPATAPMGSLPRPMVEF